jgi:hypothetical protein
MGEEIGSVPIFLTRKETGDLSPAVRELFAVMTDRAVLDTIVAKLTTDRPTVWVVVLAFPLGSM